MERHKNLLARNEDVVQGLTIDSREPVVELLVLEFCRHVHVCVVLRLDKRSATNYVKARNGTKRFLDGPRMSCENNSYSRQRGGNGRAALSNTLP